MYVAVNKLSYYNAGFYTSIYSVTFTYDKMRVLPIKIHVPIEYEAEINDKYSSKYTELDEEMKEFLLRVVSENKHLNKKNLMDVDLREFFESKTLISTSYCYKRVDLPDTSKTYVRLKSFLIYSNDGRCYIILVDNSNNSKKLKIFSKSPAAKVKTYIRSLGEELEDYKKRILAEWKKSV